MHTCIAYIYDTDGGPPIDGALEQWGGGAPVLGGMLHFWPTRFINDIRVQWEYELCVTFVPVHRFLINNLGPICGVKKTWMNLYSDTLSARQRGVMLSSLSEEKKML